MIECKIERRAPFETNLWEEPAGGRAVLFALECVQSFDWVLHLSAGAELFYIAAGKKFTNTHLPTPARSQTSAERHGQADRQAHRQTDARAAREIEIKFAPLS